MRDEFLGDGVQTLQLRVTIGRQCVLSAGFCQDFRVLLAGRIFQCLGRNQFAQTRGRAHIDLGHCGACSARTSGQEEGPAGLPARR